MEKLEFENPELSGTQSVDRALKLLAIVGRHAERGVPLSDVVQESSLNKPTARRLLMALMRAGLIEQDADTRRYFIGEEAYVLGTLASRRYGLLELSVESLRALSEISTDTSFLSVRRENYAVCLHREEGTHPVRTHALQVGFQHPLGVGAGSLAILAALPDREIERVLSEIGQVLVSRYPGYSAEQVWCDVALTRSRGFSLNPGRLVSSSWGIGAAIRFPDGRVAGALSIAAIDSRMREDRQDDLSVLLRSEVARVEEKLRRMFAARPGERGGPAIETAIARRRSA